MLSVGLVAVGGFLGAISRYGVAQVMSRRFPSNLPLGTLTVNLLGSLGLGMLFAADIHTLSLLFGTGFMGAFTTFSTFKVEGMRLWRGKDYRILLLYYTLSYTLGIGLAAAGYAGVRFLV